MKHITISFCLMTSLAILFTGCGDSTLKNNSTQQKSVAADRSSNQAAKPLQVEGKSKYQENSKSEAATVHDVEAKFASPEAVASAPSTPRPQTRPHKGFSPPQLTPPHPGRDLHLEEAPQVGPEHNTETYDHITENRFHRPKDQPLSTFSIDVDTASYANVRRMLNQGVKPPLGAVRIEELVNYFSYQYPQPEGDVPFSVNVDMADCPWNSKHRLARIGLKGKEVHHEERPPCNLVFLLDVSGSMKDRNKLPYVKESMKLLLSQLDDKDRIAIVVYASASGLVLPSTSAANRNAIIDSLNRLSAGGSTNGGAGIQLAYQIAEENKIEDGVNRVILCTDGDFNIGQNSQSELVELIQQKAQSGVALTVLGFGMGNYKDSTMEKLADKGNGNYGYIDTLAEAQKVLVEELSGTLITIAKDVKIQIDFNPAQVQAYRLIGYENRMLKAEDFKDDKKDAGEIGAGHTVTAFYELVPVGVKFESTEVEPSKYQQTSDSKSDANQTAKQKNVLAANKPDLLESFTVRLRYKEPEGTTGKEFHVPVVDQEKKLSQMNDDFRFAASVAAFGLVLRHSEYRGEANLQSVFELAKDCIGEDKHGYRVEFLSLVKKAQKMNLEPTVSKPPNGAFE